MSAEIIPFRFHTRQVRIVPSEDGATFWFVAQDVTQALGYARARDALRHVPDEHKGAQKVRTPGGEQDVLCVDEAGLYRLILRSNKPEAEPFMEWVTAKVLPTIRRTGSYNHGAPQSIPVTEEVPIDELLELYRVKALYYEQLVTGKKPTRPAPQPLTDEEKQDISILTAQGLMRSEIASRIGRSKTSVYIVQRELGLI